MLDRFSSFQKTLLLVIVGVLFYGASSTMSYAYFADTVNSGSGGKLSQLPTPAGDVEEDPGEPRTEPCPLNGQLHTQKAKDAWQSRRPLAVMIENSPDARPQSGLSRADIVYEAVAEGGITRFMAIYLCNLNEVQLGPVRSARTYFLDWASEYGKGGPLYAHVGGANTDGPADALQQIVDYRIKSMKQFSIGYPTYWRDYERLPGVATEHTMYSTTYKLWEAAQKLRKWTAEEAGVRWDSDYVSYKFKDDKPASAANQVTVNFWEGFGNAEVTWKYDPACNCYKRENGGQPHLDKNTGKQLEVKNIVVRFMRESRANDGYEGNAHLIYGNKGQGKALIIQDGKVVVGKWTKANRLAREKFLDDKGVEVSFNRGQIWLQAIPEGAKVVY